MAHYLDGADGFTDGYAKTYKNGYGFKYACLPPVPQ